MSTFTKPARGVVKISVKGVFNRNEIKGAVGCILRDSKGNWVKGCKGMIGMSVPATAELWSIYYGMKLPWKMGKRSVVVESECEEAVSLVLNPDPNYLMFDLVDLITKLKNEAWDEYAISVVAPSASLAAAALADSALSDEGGIVELTNAPVAIKPLLVTDKNA